MLFRKVAASYRVVGGRNSVESNLKEKLVELNHTFDSLFTSKDIIMKIKPKEKDEELLDDRGFKDYPTVGVIKCNTIIISNVDVKTQ